MDLHLDTNSAFCIKIMCIRMLLHNSGILLFCSESIPPAIVLHTCQKRLKNYKRDRYRLQTQMGKGWGILNGHGFFDGFFEGVCVGFIIS